MNMLKFLGTAGARFVVMKQQRASGGLWLSLHETNVLIDPGPGSLLRCLSSKPKLNPSNLDGVILTHRHLDHANDINIIIEAMTNGGFKKKGVVFAPKDAFEDDPVILKYVRKQVQRIEFLTEKGSYTLGNLSFSTPVRHHHGVETYGLNISGKTCSLSLITDTNYFTGLETYYPGDVLVLNVVLFEDNAHVDHLCLAEAETIIMKNKPRLAVLTHFGMGMVKAKPWEIAETVSEKTGVSVVAAYDGMKLNLDNLSNTMKNSTQKKKPFKTKSHA